MYFDLNVPVLAGPAAKGKGKQPVVYPVAQIDAKIDLLVHLGYTGIALCQTVNKKVEKTHVNVLDELLPALKKRAGVLYLKRLNIILDQDSEKGFGLINASIPLFNGYDIISLTPTTHTTFSQACLNHSAPSQLTAHIISLPLTLPRLPYHLKHTLIRTAIRNGAVFEINYVGALGGENDPILDDAGATQTGAAAKRNWWASARELCRVTKGKGIIVSGGSANTSHFRSPRDVANLVSMLGLAQNLSHDALTVVSKSLVLRAQTRQTYRAVLSEPEVIIPPGNSAEPDPSDPTENKAQEEAQSSGNQQPGKPNNTPKKRPREGEDSDIEQRASSTPQPNEKRKKKKQKSRGTAVLNNAS